MNNQTNSIRALARPAIRDLVAYTSARSLFDGSGMLLDANESSLDLDGKTLGLNRYPHPQPPALVDALSRLYDVPKQQLLMGRGADEAIDLLVRTFCEAQRDSITICPPTYGMYEVSAHIQGAGVARVPLRDDFSLDVDGVVNASSPQNRLTFLCSPNNPTGNLIHRKAIVDVLAALQDRSVVVVDEAYIEFSGQASVVDLLPEHPNLVVLRTLSKAWALAGARVGVALADPQIIDLLQKVRGPYPLATPIVDIVLKQLQSPRSASIADVVQRREQLRTKLTGFSCVEMVYPSAANFVLARVRNLQALISATRKAGIILRSFDGKPGLDGCVRITVGSSEELESLYRVLETLS